ncbi:MAG: hypothetical protein A3B03_00095 [Candidatus Zambryskibacteria bacterium RIFCSPLOWO2_01_FULL_42_41]|nr:MAG: hypothetical protein A2829_02330 [Candidatus Zambryskibacteria bacterium RIFCSPHIGHO2_01_FULL_43_60]OHB02804.1 MAG: hypothetical protein A3B03_00095 [Candidatus Zambryskibacteria bacterium RIFCSPLOWO2_01_FULL_42_41]
MTEDNFKKGIEGLKSIRMTSVEKARILERVFATPIKSPYMKRIPAFAYVYSLIMILSFSGATYVSGRALPGDTLYPLKIKVVEPMLDAVYRTPEEKIVWEEQKVTRRIEEAEKLLEKNELDDERLEALERSIEKSSTAFAKAANVVASSTTTSSSSAREKTKSLKQEFRKKINERQEVKVEITNTATTSDSQGGDSRSGFSDRNRNNQKEKIKRLKDMAIRFVGEEDENDNDNDRSENENKNKNKDNEGDD